MPTFNELIAESEKHYNNITTEIKPYQVLVLIEQLKQAHEEFIKVSACLHQNFKVATQGYHIAYNKDTNSFDRLLTGICSECDNYAEKSLLSIDLDLLIAYFDRYQSEYLTILKSIAADKDCEN